MLYHTSLFAGTFAPLRTDNNDDTISEHIIYLSKTEKTLNFDDIRTTYSYEQFKKWEIPALSLSIGAAPQWISFTVQNNEYASTKQRFGIISKRLHE